MTSPRRSGVIRRLSAAVPAETGSVPPKAVLDTSVLISALRSRRGASFRLLSLIGSGRLRLLLSPALVFEYEEVARREAPELWVGPDEVDELLDYIALAGEKPPIPYSLRPSLADPDDEHLLELAVCGGADAIITFDTADFRGANRFAMPILTPKEFLAKLEAER